MHPPTHPPTHPPVPMRYPIVYAQAQATIKLLQLQSIDATDSLSLDKTRLQLACAVELCIHGGVLIICGGAASSWRTHSIFGGGCRRLPPADRLRTAGCCSSLRSSSSVSQVSAAACTAPAHNDHTDEESRITLMTCCCNLQSMHAALVETLSMNNACCTSPARTVIYVPPRPFVYRYLC